MTEHFVTFKYDKDKFAQPRKRSFSQEKRASTAGSDSSSSLSFITSSAGNTVKEELPAVELTPSKIITLHYSRQTRSSSFSQTSPLKNSERRARNRTPTPSPPVSTGEPSGSSGASKASTATPERSELSQRSERSSTPQAVSPQPEGTATAAAATQAISSMLEKHSDPVQYYHNIHTVTSRLHLLKEAYKAVQALKKRKISGSETPARSPRDGAEVSGKEDGRPNYSANLLNPYTLSSPAPGPTTSPDNSDSQNTSFRGLRNKSLTDNPSKDTDMQSSEDSAADDTDTKFPRQVTIA